MTVDAQKKLLNYAARLLARRNYHSVTLREKLYSKGIGAENDIEQVLEKLKTYKYINDQAYIEYYINDQLTLRPQGIRLVRQKLFRKGIKGDDVERELARHAHREPELARKALTKKRKTLKASSEYEKREKLFRFLTSRGFSIDTVKEALSQRESAAK